jgi:hypothetical protein
MSKIIYEINPWFKSEWVKLEAYPKVKARAHPSEASFRCSTKGYAPGLTKLERNARDKHSHLIIRTLLNYRGGNFYNRGQTNNLA